MPDFTYFRPRGIRRIHAHWHLMQRMLRGNEDIVRVDQAGFRRGRIAYATDQVTAVIDVH